MRAEIQTRTPFALAAMSARISAQSWWMVAVLFGIYVFSWLDRLILSMLVGFIKSDLSLSDFQIGLALGPAFALSYAIFGLPVGWAADRYARRWVIFLGVIVWAGATVAGGFAGSFEMLLICRVFVGIGEAALLPAAYSLIADGFPPDRLTFATSVFQMAGKAGSAAAFGLGGAVIAFAEILHKSGPAFLGQAHQWQIVMVTVGAPGFLLALLVFTFREPKRRNAAAGLPSQNARTEPDDLAAFLRRHWRLIGLMMASFSCLAICGYSMTSWVPTYIARRFAWAPAEYGPALSLMNLVAAASLVVNGKIVDHLYGRGMRDVHLRFYSWLVVALLPAVFLIFYVDNAYLFLALYGVVQFVTVPFMVYISAVMALLAPSDLRGRLIALFMFVFNILGFGAGPALVGALTDYVFHDEARLGSSLAIVLIAGSLAALLAMRMGLRHLGPAVERRQAMAFGGAPCP